MEFFIAILRNLAGFDGLILLLATLNGFFYYRAYTSSTVLYRRFNQIHSLGIGDSSVLENKLTQEIHNLYQDATHQVHLFEQFTSLFPLFGLLGTVISLLRLVDFNSQTVMINFSTALTSTFWGLLLAIFFKFIYASYLSSKVELNKEIHTTMFMELREEMKASASKANAVAITEQNYEED